MMILLIHVIWLHYVQIKLRILLTVCKVNIMQL